MISSETNGRWAKQMAAGILGGLALLSLLPMTAGAGQVLQESKQTGAEVPAVPLGTTYRASLADDESQGNAASGVEGITTGVSADGRFIAFYSFASNLVPGDTNGHPDVFLRDRQTGTTTLVSRGYDGAPANGLSTLPTISADGNVIAYQSAASNLVPDDNNSAVDIFIYNRLTGTNIMIPLDGGAFGTEQAWISGNGRYVGFQTYASLVPADTNTGRDVYTVDLTGGGVELISASAAGEVGNNHSFTPQVSYDGRFVAFHSLADNLAPGDTNTYHDAFVRDRTTGQVTLVSVPSAGGQGNNRSFNANISDDGRYAAFESVASNLVADDTNNSTDVFVRDLVAGTTSRVSVASNGTQGTGHSTEPHISGDGRFVAFQSEARLAPEDPHILTDIYLRHIQTNTTELVSLATTGQAGNGYSHKPQVTRDGTFVAFGSYAANLVSGDTNDQRDVFLRDRTQLCTVTFSDVQPGSPFYPFVTCLACRGIVSGYPDGTFLPNNPVTRGQLSKIVSNAANYQENHPQQTFEDVPVGSTFHLFIERLASRGIIGGYTCGGPGEPCVPPANRPYFRQSANVTRGQTSKIVAIAANLPAPPAGQQSFEDVPTGSTFWTWIEALVATGATSGYSCGGLGEPCVPPANRPYFRPGANVTRGQSSKIVASTFFPDCQTLAP